MKEKVEEKEINREKRGGSREGKRKGRSREQVLPVGGAHPKAALLLLSSWRSKEGRGKGHEVKTRTQKVLGRADLRTHLNWRDGFL